MLVGSISYFSLSIKSLWILLFFLHAVVTAVPAAVVQQKEAVVNVDVAVVDVVLRGVVK